MCRINPRVDFAFRKLFGSEENKDILISFINSVVSEQDQVESLELLNPYNFKNFKRDKSSVLDVKAKGVDGKLFNVEMQIIDQHNYDKRSLYYWARLYSGQIGSGEKYLDLNKTISINVLNFNFLPETEYHNIYHIYNDKTQTKFSDQFELHFIELKKYNEQFSTVLDRWVNFLQRAEGYSQANLPKQLQEIPTILSAVESLDYINFSDEERDEYENTLKWMRDIVGGIEKATDDGIQEGIEKGIEIGLEKGLEKGIEVGMEKGIEKGKLDAKLEVARNLLDVLDNETIANKTGLIVDEIEKLRINKLSK